MPRKPRTPTNRKALESAAVLEEMLEMWCERGMSLLEIGNHYGISKQAVHDRFKRFAEKRAQRMEDMLEARRNRQHDDIRADLTKLEQLIDQVREVTIILDEDGRPLIDTRALAAIVSSFNAKRGLYEREGKLLGLDAASKSELSGPDGAPVVAGVFAVPLEAKTVGGWTAAALEQSAGEEDAAEAILAGAGGDDADSAAEDAT